VGKRHAGDARHREMNEDDIPPCHIRIDKEGVWYYQGLPIIHQEIYRYLNQCLKKDSSGRYILQMNGERCYLEVEDAPYVIREVTLKSPPGGTPALFIKLNEGTEEELRAETLWMEQGNVLHCRVKDEDYDARFLRSSYYQLTNFLHHDGEKYYLVVGEKKTYLPQLGGVGATPDEEKGGG
jgi:hypothetical protein